MYFFRSVDKTVIINDNYSGVLILNEDFEILKALKLFDMRGHDLYIMCLP